MSPQKGLTRDAVQKRLEQFGENVLPAKKKLSALSHFVRQFSSPLIYILVAAGVVTYALGDYTDALVIFMAVFINTLLGYYQETKAENALSALKNILQPVAKVYRNGDMLKVPVHLIVPDDIVVLHQGDRVPADGKVIESSHVSTNDSILTGESIAIRKKNGDMVFMGTTVLTGRALFKVTETGISTKMGSIADKLSSTKEASTPLQLRLQSFAHVLAVAILGISLCVFFIGILQGLPLRDMFTTSVALAVGAIPEGLTISLTVILSLGMQRILKKKALVRRLVAAEALGSVTVIATDKTGTLTEGIMRVTETRLKNMDDALDIACYANNLDDPIEFALWEWVSDHNVDPEVRNKNVKRQKEVPFDSVNKYMSVTIDHVTYMKGAPEVVMKLAKVTGAEKKKTMEQITTWSQQGLRIIALAKKTPRQKHYGWVGLIAIEDPVRKGLQKVFDECRHAGVRIVMITGDYVGTAEAVWRQVTNDHNKPIVTISGDELSHMTDDEVVERIETIDICARVSPMQKLQLVETLQKRGEIVALVGDGVNDALALKASHLGIVVGEASDVAKETADMVLLDSNFKTIIQAIHEGRGIFDNIQKVMLYLLSDSLSQIMLIVGTILMGLPVALTATQILWINIITDSLPALALTFEPHDLSRARNFPRSQSTLLSFPIMLFMLCTSFIIGLVGLLLYMRFLNVTSIEVARTVTFSYFALSTLFIIFPVRTLLQPIWKVSLFNNPILILVIALGVLMQLFVIQLSSLQFLINTASLLFSEWMYIIAAVAIVCILVELLKVIMRLFKLDVR
jgi:Ca2+-transporting ATPase